MSRTRGAPIAVQVGLLIAVCLVGAQLIALAVVALTPPPAPQVYRVSEIAAALQGGSLQPRLGRTLIRSTSDEPPHANSVTARSNTVRTGLGGGVPFGGGRFGTDRQAAALASQLGTPIERVRLVRPAPNRLIRALTGRQPLTVGPQAAAQELGAPAACAGRG